MPARMRLGAHCPVARFRVAIHPNGEWSVNGTDPEGQRYMVPVAGGRGSRRGTGRVANARTDADAAIEDFKRQREQHLAYAASIIRYEREGEQ